MNATARLSAADRNRSLARLRTLTVGTTVLSVAAVGGFGALAALTHPGTATADTALIAGSSAASGSTTSAGTTDATTSASSNIGSDTSSSTSAASGSTSGLQTGQAPATSSTGTAQVTTGGSGR